MSINPEQVSRILNIAKEMYDYISKFISIKKDDLVVDIGGNDGTLLHTFLEKSQQKLKVLNIDPI